MAVAPDAPLEEATAVAVAPDTEAEADAQMIAAANVKPGIDPEEQLALERLTLRLGRGV